MKPHSIWSAYRRTPHVHKQQPTQSKRQSLMPVVSEHKTLKHKNPRKGRQHEASLHLIGIHKNSSRAQNDNPTPNQCKLEHPSLLQPSRSSREIATASCSIASSSWWGGSYRDKERTRTTWRRYSATEKRLLRALQWRAKYPPASGCVIENTPPGRCTRRNSFSMSP